jgi:acyl-CoA thioester hydrolase
MQVEKHLYPITVLESHLDTFGHMNHAVYLQIFEEARWDLVTAKGFGLEQMRESGLGPVVLEVSLQFKRELRLRQKVVIETELVSYDKKLAKIQQKIKDENEKVYCLAEFKFGLFDMRERKLVLQTPEWLKAMGIVEP